MSDGWGATSPSSLDNVDVEFGKPDLPTEWDEDLLYIFTGGRFRDIRPSFSVRFGNPNQSVNPGVVIWVHRSKLAVGIICWQVEDDIRKDGLPDQPDTPRVLQCDRLHPLIRHLQRMICPVPLWLEENVRLSHACSLHLRQTLLSQPVHSSEVAFLQAPPVFAFCIASPLTTSPALSLPPRLRPPCLPDEYPCVLRPVFLFLLLLPLEDRFARMLVMRTGILQIEETDNATRTSWPPPSRVEPSSVNILFLLFLETSRRRRYIVSPQEVVSCPTLLVDRFSTACLLLVSSSVGRSVL